MMLDTSEKQQSELNDVFQAKNFRLCRYKSPLTKNGKKTLLAKSIA